MALIWMVSNSSIWILSRERLLSIVNAQKKGPRRKKMTWSSVTFAEEFH